MPSSTLRAMNWPRSPNEFRPGEAVDVGGERLDRSSEALARMMAAAARQEAGEEIVDAVRLGTLEEEAAEGDGAERDERRRVMLLHDEADAVPERAGVDRGFARGAGRPGGRMTGGVAASGAVSCSAFGR
mgnify:CR=1 FL=1